jgi:hypothetical protein
MALTERQSLSAHRGGTAAKPKPKFQISNFKFQISNPKSQIPNPQSQNPNLTRRLEFTPADAI